MSSEAPKVRPEWKAWIRRHSVHYLKDPNITSVGIGYKIVDGKRTDALCFQFTVREKVSGPELETLGTSLIPEMVDSSGVQLITDVVQRSYELAYQVVPEAFDDDRRRRIDPLVPGVSISHPTVSAGTLGAIVYDRSTGQPAVLSNWHVLHGPEGHIGDTVLQPGTHDDNSQAGNQFGTLLRSHLGAAGDAALASISQRGFNTDIMELGVTPAEIADPELDDKVIKSGRTTGVSHGVVTRVETMVSLDYGGSIGEKSIGCFEIEPDPRHIKAFDQLSDGGDSGSAWMFKAGNGHTSNVMGGLHFAGSDTPDTETALACYASSVRDKLEFSLDSENAQQAALEKALGFDPAFLASEVAVPDMSPELIDDAVTLHDSTTIDYTHFSLAQSQKLKFARWVAWNVDGGNIQRLSRKGISFNYDSRFSREFQAGDDLYKGNDLDRGHIARRADLTWGNREEAMKANRDSFTFTNIAPQMNTFNQSSRDGVWGELEDSLFAAVEVDKLRISVIGGPVFKESDRIYRGYSIPREFFKIIYYVTEDELRAQGFLLSQDLADLEILNLDKFNTHQVPLATIEERTGLAFTTPAQQGPALESIQVIDHVGQIQW
ncbi:DNA/RNA non-specific endonuclease [Corynebacterium breve]|uniref:DNA/RNA non-specific endonuclease n=1 Tax=Corynebacterium breve TaxID=3049799 RepID=A0ABY8VK01_9CORY|nr:DNA/RNA non-specific endonuclease [Corynebacterium breve]WIM68524.1 DNA/RNA non-specific endonuclease [Corynebacterium breve]